MWWWWSPRCRRRRPSRALMVGLVRGEVASAGRDCTHLGLFAAAVAMMNQPYRRCWFNIGDAFSFGLGVSSQLRGAFRRDRGVSRR